MRPKFGLTAHVPYVTQTGPTSKRFDNSFTNIKTKGTNVKLTTVNDLINARTVYLILGVKVGAFNRWEAFKRQRRLFS